MLDKLKTAPKSNWFLKIAKNSSIEIILILLNLFSRKKDDLSDLILMQINYSKKFKLN